MRARSMPICHGTAQGWTIRPCHHAGVQPLARHGVGLLPLRRVTRPCRFNDLDWAASAHELSTHARTPAGHFPCRETYGEPVPRPSTPPQLTLPGPRYPPPKPRETLQTLPSLSLPLYITCERARFPPYSHSSIIQAYIYTLSSSSPATNDRPGRRCKCNVRIPRVIEDHGFPLVCYCVVIPKPVIAFCKLVAAVRDALLLLLSLVGLCRSPRRSVDDAPLPEEVKARLPAVEFAWLPRPEQQGCHDGDAGAATCIVCLERLEATDEVRRLGNCAHAFHRGCIDGWIDLGRTTCPLCRSHLLPRARRASLLTRVW